MSVTTSSPADVDSPRGTSWLRRYWLLGACGLLVAAALAAAVAFGSTYQPVTYGEVAVAIQGSVQTRIVNNFGNMTGQLDIPPQPARNGALIVSLTNTGPYPVTIKAVGILANSEQAGLVNALEYQNGPVTYVPARPDGPLVTSSSPRIAGATLRPGQNAEIRIPFRTPACWLPRSRILVTSFWVTTKFLWRTRTFAINWTRPDDPDGNAIMSQIPDPNDSASALCPHSRT